MSRKNLDSKLYERLREAESELEAGRLSRREFNKLLALIGTTLGLTVAEMTPAYAWVATRMRKRRSSGSSSFAASNSLRFRAASSTSLTRTFGAAPLDRTKGTISVWVKKTGVGGNSYIFSGWDGSAASASHLYFGSDQLYFYTGGASAYGFTTAAVFRDPTAWYHVVAQWDTTQAVAARRLRIFVNGIEQTASWYLAPPQNHQVLWALTNSYNKIGVNYNVTSSWADGYMSEFYFVDGQALTPSAFGQEDATSGQWSPKQYSGTFGTNGFYLPFKSNAAVNGSGAASGSYPNVAGVSGLGADWSGNNHHWTGTNLATTDQMLDVPTNNFATLNPLMLHPSYLHSYVDANLKYVNTDNTSAYAAFASQVMTTKTYFEVRVPDGTTGSYPHFGAAVVTTPTLGSLCGNEPTMGGFGLDCSLKKLWVEGAAVYNAGAALAANDVVGIAYDPSTGRVWMSINGTWLNSGNPAGNSNPLGTVSTSRDSLVPSVISYLSKNIELNFGQGGWSGVTYDSDSGGAFKSTPPSGFKALCTANLSTPTILKPSQYFQAWTYNGNGGTKRIGAVVPTTPTYTVSKSLRFTGGNSPSLTRTAGASTDAKKLTLSMWFKPGSLSGSRFLFNSGGNNTAGNLNMFLLSSGQINIFQYQTGTGYQFDAMTSEAFVNATDWHHLIVQIDTTAATNTDRIKIWVNSRVQTLVADTGQSNGLSWPAQNSSLYVSGVQYSIGTYTYTTGNYYDGLLTEYYAVDGQALTPSSFGQTDSTSGDWLPKQYTGSYGTNGFYINFSDNSNTTSTTLGRDSSGNGNNFTPSGFSTSDALGDTPTNSFCSLNPLVKGSAATVTAGNLAWSASTAVGQYQTGAVAGTYPMSSGKWYYEYTATSSPYSPQIGIGLDGASEALIASAAVAGTHFYYGYSTAQYYYDGNGVVYGATFTSGDVIGVAFDADTGSLTFYKNGSSQGVACAALPAGTYYPLIAPGSSGVTIAGTLNFGQGGLSGLTYDAASGGTFKYTPPSGYKALSAANLRPVASSAQITPDLVWIKGRSGATDHAFYDSVRGVFLDHANKYTTPETTEISGVSSFTKTGFSMGSLAKLNGSGGTYAAWGWKKGATPGFDVVTYSGDGTATHSVPHSLGATPSMIVILTRTQSTDHQVYHASLGKTYSMFFDLADAQSSYYSQYWGNTDPTTSNFYVGSPSYANTSGHSYVAYLWSEVPGFSKFGAYKGNGSTNGPFIWCGFRPRWIMAKRADGAYDWRIVDAARNPVNMAAKLLNANDNGAEADVTSDGMYDILSNGFKIRNPNAGQNASGGTYIFAAFAEAPFKYALAR